MALVDSSGRAVRSGSGRAIGSGTSSGNNNSGGDGRAANRARSSANLAAAKAAAARNAAAVETQRRNQDGQSQIKAAEAQALAQQQAVQQAAANRKMQEQIAAAERQQQQQQNQQGIAAYKAMMAAPAVATTPTAPTQFTQGRSGTSYYPENAPDTMFRGLMGNITGGGLLSGAADMVGEDSYVGGLLKAYGEFDPLGDFAQQTVYGMNDIARDEYVRQEASNPNWPMMSEKERVQLARKPQRDNQLPHAFINDGISNTANDAQLNAMRPFIKDSNMSEAQFNSLPIEMKRQLTRDVNPNNLIIGSANQGDNPYIPPVEEVAPESYTSYMTDYSPMFSFAGKSGLSSFAKGGVVKSQGIGRLFEDINR